MEKSLNTPVWQLTVGELFEMFDSYFKPEQPQKPTLPNDWQPEDVVYGIAGIAKLLGVSKVTVHEFRKQGWIEPAIKQGSRRVLCNAPLALELFGKRGK